MSVFAPLTVQLQSNTTNTVLAGPLIQSGWGWVIGASTAPSKTVTFPVAYSSAPYVTLTMIGFKNGSDPSSITDCSALGQDTAGQANTPSTTTFSAQAINVNNSAYGGTTRLLFCWIAIGPA